MNFVYEEKKSHSGSNGLSAYLNPRFQFDDVKSVLRPSRSRAIECLKQF